MIYSQDTAADLRVGLGSTAKNGCGWIAAYNTFLLMNDFMAPEVIIIKLKSVWFGLRLFGLWGIRSHSLVKLFKSKGYTVKRKLFPRKNRVSFDDAVQTSRVLILEYIWRNPSRRFWNGGVGGHYVAIRYVPEDPEGNYYIYAEGSGDTEPRRLFSVDDWVRKQRAVVSVTEVS